MDQRGICGVGHDGLAIPGTQTSCINVGERLGYSGASLGVQEKVESSLPVVVAHCGAQLRELQGATPCDSIT